jgi:dipeptidase E
VPELLLLSSSTAPGRAFLEHALEVIAEILQERRRVLFVAFAPSDPDHYTQLMQDCLSAIGVQVEAAHSAADPLRAIMAAEAVFVGGGNSFRLVRTMASIGALGPLRARIMDGVPYLGASAGALLACPTIRTTTDMPIVELGSLAALGLIPFQVSPHYPDPEPAGRPGSEDRRARLARFLEENDVPVLGLPEGTWLRVSDGVATLGGVAGGRLFARGEPVQMLPAGADVSELLTAVARFDSPR